MVLEISNDGNFGHNLVTQKINVANEVIYKLHALGPGHGKVVVSTYLATHKTKVKTGIYITIASALMQGVVAIVLVSLFTFVWHQTMHQLNATVSELVELSGIFVVLLGVYLILMVMIMMMVRTECYRLRRRRRKEIEKEKEKTRRQKEDYDDDDDNDGDNEEK